MKSCLNCECRECSGASVKSAEDAVEPRLGVLRMQLSFIESAKAAMRLLRLQLSSSESAEKMQLSFT